MPHVVGFQRLEAFDPGTGLFVGISNRLPSRRLGAQHQGVATGEIKVFHIDAHVLPSLVFPLVSRHESDRPKASGEAAAIDDEALTGDVARSIRREKHAEWPQLPPFAEASDRNHLPALF